MKDDHHSTALRAELRDHPARDGERDERAEGAREHEQRESAGGDLKELR